MADIEDIELNYVFDSTSLSYSFDYTASTWDGRYTNNLFTYHFNSANKSSISGGEQISVGDLVELWDRFTIFDLTKTTSNPADIYLYKADNTDSNGITGHFENNSQTTSPNPYPASTYTKAEIAFENSWTLGDTGFERWLVLHEVGHALGLAHDFSYTSDMTVMSYDVPIAGWNGTTWTTLSTGRFPITPMAYDIAAIEDMYGGSPSVSTGSDTYGLAPSFDGTNYTDFTGENYANTIMDTGGTDTFDLSDYTDSVGGGVRIDLREAIDAYDEWVNARTIVGEQYTYIARGSVIENAKGSAGDDTITGNEHDNTIWGGSGDDTVTTGDADNYDVVVYEFDPNDYDFITDFTIGEDKIDLTAFGMLRQDVEADAVQSGGNVILDLNGHGIVVQGVDKVDLFDDSTFDNFIGLIGGTQGANVVGTSAKDTLDAADGVTAYNDTITGAGGNDNLHGLAGNDLFVFAPGDGQDIIYETPSLAETNVIRLDGISWEDVYLDCPTSSHLYINVDDGASGRIKINNQWYGDESTGGYEVKYLQMDDKIIDLTGGLLYRGDGPGQGDTIKARNDIATNDTMDGGDGDDQLYGYDGDDTYIFAVGYGRDLVRDEGAGTGDNILKIGTWDHFTDSGIGNVDRTYYLDNTNTDYIKIFDFALGSWEVI